MQLSEKLRLNYGNMNPGTRRNKFGQLVHEVQAKENKLKLVRALMQNLENKSSLASKDGFEEFRLVLVKLEAELQ